MAKKAKKVAKKAKAKKVGGRKKAAKKAPRKTAKKAKRLREVHQMWGVSIEPLECTKPAFQAARKGLNTRNLHFPIVQFFVAGQ